MPFVAYYRVSTQRQGASGLGLDAQRAAVADYLRGEVPAMEFTEVESGRKTDRGRPELAKAIEACRLYRAHLVMAKLDRLARNAYFLHRLKASGLEFLCCDMPDANHLTISILAAVAEDEARRISDADQGRSCYCQTPRQPPWHTWWIFRSMSSHRSGAWEASIPEHGRPRFRAM